MNKISVEVQPEQRRFYDLSTLAGKLENYLIENKMSDFGNYELGLRNRTMANGEERYAGLDMSDDERGIRSLIVKELEKVELEKIHELEKKKMNRFLMITEIERLLHKPLNLTKDKPYRKWTEKFKDYMKEYNDRHKPICKKFHDLIVPPYHIYDLEFDGMTYHHAIDDTVFYGEPILYKEMGGKKGKELVELMD